MEWKVLDRKYISKDPPWFTARVEKVELPNGEILDRYYIMEYPDWATVLAIDEEGFLIMIRQYRHAKGITAFELPAGVIDDSDESPMHAAKRELLEETGYGDGEWEQYMRLCANPGTHTNWCYTFIARNVRKIKEQELDRTEDLIVERVSIERVKKMLTQDEIIQALHAAVLWKLLFEEESKSSF